MIGQRFQSMGSEAMRIDRDKSVCGGNEGAWNTKDSCLHEYGPVALIPEGGLPPLAEMRAIPAAWRMVQAAILRHAEYEAKSGYGDSAFTR